MSYINAIIIGIVQGITEFLPISSTGHMIIAQSLLGINNDDFTKLFIVSIHLGTILSVFILYWKKFFQSFNFYYKLIVAFFPAAILGFLFEEQLSSLLGNVMVVAISLFLGGIILLFVDKWFKNNTNDNDISYKSAFKIGLFQVIAMIPGVSRSAATIIGGMTQKLTRKAAAEFSFFLAIPTMLGATTLELFKNYSVINTSNIKVLIVGNIVSLIVALIVIKIFITFLQKHGFRIFGYYRIILGLTILILLFSGYNLSILD